MNVRFTNHAICRYVQRVMGIDMPACNFSSRDCRGQVNKFVSMGLDLGALYEEIFPLTDKNRISFELARGNDKIRVETMRGDIVTIAGLWGGADEFVAQTIYIDEGRQNAPIKEHKPRTMQQRLNRYK